MPPAASVPGVWLRTGSSGNAVSWILAAAAGAAAGADASNWVKHTRPSQVTSFSGVKSYGVGDPCYEPKSKRPFPDVTRIAEFTGVKKVLNLPYLDCGGLRKAVSRHGLPARMKSIVDCIEKIMMQGTAVFSNGIGTWHLAGGIVRTDATTGRIIGARPMAGGGWTKCAGG